MARCVVRQAPSDGDAMTDSEVSTALKTLLDDSLEHNAIFAPCSIQVFQSYNPATASPTEKPILSFSKVSARRWGWPKNTYVYDAGNTRFDAVVSWYLRATWRVTALIRQDVTFPESLNAFDVIDFCAAALQTPTALQYLKNYLTGIGIDRIIAIPTPQEWDDSDRFNMEANFTFVLNYMQTFQDIENAALAVTGSTTRV